MSEIRPQWDVSARKCSLFYTLPETPVLSQEYSDNFLKSKLNVSDYSLIQDYIAAATNDSELSTNRAYITRTVTAVYDYVYEKVNLTLAPASSVVGVTAIDPYTASAYALTTADYTVVGDSEKYLVVEGYAGYRLQVVYTAGYGSNPEDCPAWVRDAVSSRLAAKYAVQPMEMAMYERRYRDAEARNKFWVKP